HGSQEGMHGFVLAFLAGVSRFAAGAKLWDLRRQRGDGGGNELVPVGLEEMLAFMLRVAREGGGEGRDGSLQKLRHLDSEVPPRPAAPPAKNPLIVRAPLLAADGCGVGARHFVLALIEAGEAVALAPEPVGCDREELEPDVLATLTERILPADTPAEL